MTKIFAHRGASSTHPENTMLAFIEAERVKADGIELDVQLSKDGQVVIIHDFKIDRTTNGKGFVKDMTLKEIQAYDAGARFKNGKYQAWIPSLYEFLVWFKNTNMICNIEFKTVSITNKELEEKTVALVKHFHLEDRIIFSSFNHYSIVYCYRLAPEIETAALYNEGIYMPWVYSQSIRAKAIHPHYKVVPNEIIKLSQENGVKVRPFTVNKKKDLQRFFENKVEAVITNVPEYAIQLRDISN